MVKYISLLLFSVTLSGMNTPAWLTPARDTQVRDTRNNGFYPRTTNQQQIRGNVRHLGSVNIDRDEIMRSLGYVRTPTGYVKRQTN